MAQITATPILKKLFGSLLLISSVSLFPGCAPEHAERSADPQAKSLVSRSAQLQIYERTYGYLVEINSPQDSASVLARFELHRDSAQRTSASTLHIPIGKVAATSLTFHAMLAALGHSDALVGLSYTAGVHSGALSERIAAGEVQELVSGGAVDIERVLQSKAQVLLVDQVSEALEQRFSAIPSLTTIPILEHLEQEPLARLEWIKLLGCLFDSYGAADSLFQQVSRRYLSLADMADSLPERPSVFIGSTYGREWYVPAGASYMATLISDAGGRYAFSEMEGQGSTLLDREAFIQALLHTDYAGVLIASDVRLRRDDVVQIFAPVAHRQLRHKTLFACNTAQSNYFTTGMLAPDLLLADLIAILHPQALTAHEPAYFYILD